MPFHLIILSGFVLLQSCGPGIAALDKDATEDGPDDSGEEDVESDEEHEGCPEGLVRCDDHCVDILRNDEHCGGCERSCDEDEVCLAGACACPPGSTACGEECVHTESDDAHCGGCGQPCEESQVCSSGVCLSECGSGLTECENGDCVDLDSSRRHCGSCENACDDSEVCVESACRPYEPPFECGACPCNACDDLGFLCCPFGEPQEPLCIDAPACPQR